MPHKLTTITSARHSLRRGFTLVELAASMTILTILMGAMTSTILIASHALPDSEDPAAKKMEAMDVVDQIAGELFYATSITEATVNSVTFTVAAPAEAQVDWHQEFLNSSILSDDLTMIDMGGGIYYVAINDCPVKGIQDDGSLVNVSYVITGWTSPDFSDHVS